MKSIIYSGDYRVLNHTFHITPWKQGEPYYHDILERTSQQLEAMLSYHSKVHVIRYDLHVQEYTETSEDLSKFIRALRQRLKRKYGHARLGYVWCREQNLSNKQHYHIALMINGNLFKSSHTISAIVDELWTRLGHSVTFKPENHIYKIQRGDESVALAAFKRMAYLAKVRTKGKRKGMANDYSTSRLKPKLLLH
ncbi:YagK/YfjJ domain-containing protein [Neptuniibacter halophilus]|uniref:YagK/YfjJ domain-containing protein n=1 Tax=Neptuniibacter halophilus TaxID=651666 RepID=UPI0025743403|nr:inovirus-type Gp2 protein [Neptuniibacter halophilus]